MSMSLSMMDSLLLKKITPHKKNPPRLRSDNPIIYAIRATKHSELSITPRKTTTSRATQLDNPEEPNALSALSGHVDYYPTGYE